MTSEIQEVLVPQELVTNSSGLAVDIGGSLAKIVYRCKETYKNGQLINPSKPPNAMGYLKMLTFPREDLTAYIQYIMEHADLTGEPPVVNSCGIGVFEYKETLEAKLKIRLNNLTEFRCFINALMRMIRDPAGTEHFLPLDKAGVEEGKDSFYTNITFQYIADGLPVPAASEFGEDMEKVVQKVESSLQEDISLSCLVVMAGSGFPLMVLHEPGKLECADVTLFGGRSFLGLAAIMTGETDWLRIQDHVASHDGSTTWTHITSSLLEEDLHSSAKEQGVLGNKVTTPEKGMTDDKGENSGEEGDPYQVLKGTKIFPFGNGNICPKESLRPGDLLNTLFDVVATNLGTLAYNVALAQDLRQVLFCGGFANLSQARTIITREIMGRNMRAHHAKKTDKIVDFRFIRNAVHLGSIGAYLDSEPFPETPAQPRK